MSLILSVSLQGKRSSFPKPRYILYQDVTKIVCIHCRAKDHPTPSLDKYCTRMSLRLSEDNNWESTNCGRANSAVAACQYQYKAVDIQERNKTDGILPQNALRHDCNDKYIELIRGHYLEVMRSYSQ